MKSVFLLWVCPDYEGSETLLGVFSSNEKAQEYKNDVIEWDIYNTLDLVIQERDLDPEKYE